MNQGSWHLKFIEPAFFLMTSRRCISDWDKKKSENVRFLMLIFGDLKKMTYCTIFCFFQTQNKCIFLTFVTCSYSWLPTRKIRLCILNINWFYWNNKLYLAYILWIILLTLTDYHVWGILNGCAGPGEQTIQHQHSLHNHWRVFLPSVLFKFSLKKFLKLHSTVLMSDFSKVFAY